MPRTVFRNANLLDGKSPARPDASVAIEGDRIVAVGGPELGPAPGDRTLDLGGRTLLPGLWSCHFHAAFEDATLDIFPIGIDKPPGYLMLRAAKNARLALECGFTGVVGAGCGDDLDAQLDLAIQDGLVPGPRIMPGSRNFGTTSGYIDLESWWWKLGNLGACRMVDGPEDCRKAVRDEIRRGARMIKVFATGGHGNVQQATSEFGRDELAAIVTAAHEHGAKVRAHCAWKRELLECVELGFDAIDHADALDAECIAAMHERGTFLVPSALFLDKLLSSDALRTPDAAPLVDVTERELANLIEQVPRANQAGVKIVLGDDFGVFAMPHGSYAEELAFYVKRAHVPPLDVIRWATMNGAELAGRGEELGSVEVGKLADLLVVDGDPSVDITVLGVPDRLRAIMKGGVFEKDELSG
jgi:imidazolonepropionase-like amidohydrolase